MNSSLKPSFYYEKYGSGKNKIIFLHGFGASHTSFYDLLPFFDKSYEIYLVDLIGFGNSKFVPGWNYTFNNQVKLLYDFIKNMNLSNITIAGHSYGGGVTLLLNLLAENLNDKNTIKNLVLLAPACYRQKIPFFIRLPMNHPFLYKLFMKLIPKKVLAKHVLNNLYSNKKRITKSKLERYANYFRKKDNINAICETAKNIIPENVDELETKIATIKTPALLIWGTKDFIVPGKNTKRLNKELINSKLEIIKDSGHMVQEEQPEKTFTAIDKFIKR